MENELKFAVLIDADNISDKYIKIILEETANSGIATYKRITGTGPARSWPPGRRFCWIIPLSPCSSTATPREKMPRIRP